MFVFESVTVYNCLVVFGKIIVSKYHIKQSYVPTYECVTVNMHMHCCIYDIMCYSNVHLNILWS